MISQFIYVTCNINQLDIINEKIRINFKIISSRVRINLWRWGIYELQICSLILFRKFKNICFFLNIKTSILSKKKNIFYYNLGSYQHIYTPHPIPTHLLTHLIFLNYINKPALILSAFNYKSTKTLPYKAFANPTVILADRIP